MPSMFGAPARPSLCLGLLALAAAALAGGCASDCGNNCPLTTVYIGASTNTMLNIQDLAWDGPACPPGRPYCRGDDSTTSCTHITITGVAEGECQLFINFGDRPAQIVHARFGPAVTQGCCMGFTVVGDSHFTIPVSADGGIYGADGNTDAVTTVVPDAGTDPPAPADAGAPEGDASPPGD
jgi:hypothetical protein